jgi:L-lactate dehydrogenase (cytochrome)
MSVADAKRAVDIGASGIMVSNHGGRQLDGSRSPFDQLAEIVDAVGDRIDVICDGGIRRRYPRPESPLGRRKSVLRRPILSLCPRGCGTGRRRKGAPDLHSEIERDMKLIGCRTLDMLSRENLRFR